MKGKRAIPNNPYYAEILFRIADRKVYPSQFINEFRDYKKEAVAQDFSPGGALKKTVQTLHRQLMKLHEEGYVLIDDEDENGKKHRNNVKYFSVNWGKIIEDFNNHVLERKKKENKDIFKDMVVQYEKEDVRDRLKKNVFLVNVFRFFFDEFRASAGFNSMMDEYKPVLSVLFETIIDLDLMLYARGEIEAYGENYTFPEEVHDDYDSFYEYAPFCSDLYGFKEFVSETFRRGIIGSGSLKNIIGDKNWKKYLLDKFVP